MSWRRYIVLMVQWRRYILVIDKEEEGEVEEADDLDSKDQVDAE